MKPRTDQNSGDGRTRLTRRNREGRLSSGQAGAGIARLSLAVLLIGIVCIGPVAGGQGGYRLGKSDLIRVAVAGDESLSGDFPVSETGSINFPVLGELHVEGLTAPEVVALVRRLLIDKSILTEPAVSVAVKEFRSQYVTVLGEVSKTGRYFLRGEERLVDVIAEQGGLTPNAGEISVSRKNGDNFTEITVASSALPRDATVMRHGDVVFVKTRPLAQVFVSGEVTSVRPLVYFEGMTVSQAILSAGGLTRFGSKSKITVKRMNAGKEEFIRINLADIEKGKAKDIPVRPNDQILVGRRVF